MVNQDRLIAEFMELTAIDSVSFQEKNIKDILADRLAALGLDVYEDDAGNATGSNAGNLIAKMAGTGSGSVFFCAHMDTVQPGIGVQPIINGEWIESSGDTILGADDKAGIAAIMEMIRILREKSLPHPNIEIIFTISEEQGLMGARYLDYNQVRSSMGYVLDTNGPVGTIVIQGPSQNEIEVEVRGRAAHAGINPEAGVNAIFAAGYAISHLRVGRIDDETTCNMGTIHGGEARNIVPDKVVIRGEARSLDARKLSAITEEIKQTFMEKTAEKEAECSVKITHLYPALQLSPTEPVVEIAARAARALGFTPALTRTGGGSDANLFNERGIPTANIGVGFQAVHTVNERIRIDSLVSTTRWLLQIIQEMVNE